MTCCPTVRSPETTSVCVSLASPYAVPVALGCHAHLSPRPAPVLLSLGLLPGFHQGLILLTLFGREEFSDLGTGLRLHLLPHRLAAFLGLFPAQGSKLLRRLLEYLAEPGLLL